MFVRKLARSLLGSLFVTGGIDVIRNPEPREKLAGPTIDRIRDALPVPLPADNTRVVQLNAAVQIGAGLALSSGRMPRLAALTLAGSLVPTTLAGHPYWTQTDPQQKAMQKVHFKKNVAILGGLLVAALDTGGRPSVSWRARRAARRLPSVSPRHLPLVSH